MEPSKLQVLRVTVVRADESSANWSTGRFSWQWTKGRGLNLQLHDGSSDNTAWQNVASIGTVTEAMAFAAGVEYAVRVGTTPAVFMLPPAGM